MYKIEDITKTNVNIDSPSTIFKLRPDWAGVLKFPSPAKSWQVAKLVRRSHFFPVCTGWVLRWWELRFK
ncbi:MAG: hypothetical protein R3F61_20020 [Myxococcota bacterium]